MALDEAASEALASGLVGPTIRLYLWRPGAVSIGYFQSLAQEVDRDRCGALGIDVVRRRTGGGAVYHAEGGEVTYSVIAPEGLFPGITESYRLICGWVVEGLARLGIKGEFRPVNDILVRGRKISGSAQTRRGGILHQHGTILYRLDKGTMFSILRVGKEKLAGKGIERAEAGVTSVSEHSKATLEELCAALQAGLTEGKEWVPGAWTDGELERAEELVQKYRDIGWNGRR
ncbi:MAG: lipoate--protein ligase family protein [Euryarchaeota archaeon]|nr:lipoate--protein ligase family protein [Euryarchaeota archaeon]